MDVNVVSLPTTVPWAAIATLLGVIVTLVFTYFSNAQRLSHERKTKLREDRQRAYATMARITKGMKVEDPLEIQDLAEAHSEIEMLTEDPQVLGAAGQVLYAAHMARQAVAQKEAAIEDESAMHPAQRTLAIRKFNVAKEELDQYRTDFINLARKELGLGPRPSLASPEPEELPGPTSKDP